MKHLLFFFAALLVSTAASPQSEAYARDIITVLASEKYEGRGYYKNGARKSAKYLRKTFKNSGLKPVGGDFFQPFNIAINCITGKPELALNGRPLVPGTEFLVSRNSPTIKGTFKVKTLNTAPADLDSLLAVTEGQDLSETFIATANTNRVLMEENVFDAAGVILLTKQLWWHVSNGHQVMDIPVIKAGITAAPEEIHTVTVAVRNKYHEAYTTENVAAMVRGTRYPEKYILLTAHYDHLGRMGKEVYFPGAHDNASGTAMIADLARYFAQNPAPVSLLFIAFSAEETGLEGSKYYAQNPLVPLDSTLFSLNLDIIGSGSTGITVVNGSVLPEYFSLLTAINEKNTYVKNIGKRGEAANSDHYFLYKNGVPAFFIYTTGEEYTEYHNVNDRAEGLPLTAYNGLFGLVRDFVLLLPIPR